MPATDDRTPDSRPVSVLGLGMMGTALASALLKAGHPTTVWNRSPAKSGPLVAQGATPADTARDAVTASPLVIVCLTTNDNVRDLLAPLTEELRGRTLVNLTNGTPSQARDLAAWAREHGVSYVDGGIMAVPQMIAGPQAYILYSGDEDAYTTHRETLAALADTKWVGTDAGLAALWDLALLTGMYGMVLGVSQAYALIGSAGVPAKDFAPLLLDWVGAMTHGIVPGTAEALDSGQHLTDVSSLAVNQAAVPNIASAFAEQGVQDLLFASLRPLLDRAVAEGHGADGLSRLTELLKTP
ncbi:NAD(P)-dependent oxidoreductase [Streptomyces sp. NPDC017941]|uniref:NAD(P)-dependent oxidoreductase n=1 Tax=unclassified Streptomyces TaxID=2593676 RepID=UPI0037B80B3C